MVGPLVEERLKVKKEDHDDAFRKFSLGLHQPVFIALDYEDVHSRWHGQEFFSGHFVNCVCVCGSQVGEWKWLVLFVVSVVCNIFVHRTKKPQHNKQV